MYCSPEAVANDRYSLLVPRNRSSSHGIDSWEHCCGIPCQCIVDSTLDRTLYNDGDDDNNAENNGDDIQHAITTQLQKKVSGPHLLTPHVLDKP